MTPAIRTEAVRVLGCGGPSVCPPARREPHRLPGTRLWAQSRGKPTSFKARPSGFQKNTVPTATIASISRTTLLTPNVWLFHTNHPLCKQNMDWGALRFHSVLTAMPRVSPEPPRGGSAPREPLHSRRPVECLVPCASH